MKSSIIMILLNYELRQIYACFLVLTIVLTMYKGWKIKLEEQSKEVVTVTHTEKCVTVTTSLLYLSILKIPDSICIHFCISNYLWLNFQELTMNKKTSVCLTCSRRWSLQGPPYFQCSTTCKHNFKAHLLSIFLLLDQNKPDSSSGKKRKHKRCYFIFYEL